MCVSCKLREWNFVYTHHILESAFCGFPVIFNSFFGGGNWGSMFSEHFKTTFKMVFTFEQHFISLFSLFYMTAFKILFHSFRCLFVILKHFYPPPLSRGIFFIAVVTDFCVRSSADWRGCAHLVYASKQYATRQKFLVFTRSTPAWLQSNH